MSYDPKVAQATEAEIAALEAEATKNALTSAMCVILWAVENFAEWRAWANAHGWESGPADADTLQCHGQWLAVMTERVL